MAKRLRDSGGGVLSWERFRGRNGVDDPAMLPADMGTEAINWVIDSQGIGSRRRGSVNAGLTGSFTGYASMVRFVPAQDDAQAQLVFSTWDAPSKFMVLTPASTPAATAIPQGDQLIGNPCNVSYAVGNGKLFCAYQSTGGNRLHVYDPTHTGAMVVAGMAAPGAAASVAVTGSGSLPAGARWYRIQQRVLYSDGAKGAVSALGPATSYTAPAGAAAIRITVGATQANANEWRVFGSADGILYYDLSGWLHTITSVPYFDDTLAPLNYGTRPAAPLEGSRYPLPSAKYLLWDGAHLLLFGSYGDQANNPLPAVPGRVYITLALDSTDDGGEDESISMTTEVKGYIDLNRNGGCEDRAICGQIDGNILVFQSRGIWLLKPTGSFQRPYARIALSRELGALSNQSTFIGEDEMGRPAIYFLDPMRGPYRYGYDGLQWLGYDITDLWDHVNLEALQTVACGVYDPRTRRCYWWLATGTTHYPLMGLTFHVQEGRLTSTQGLRYGWTQFDGRAASCNCVCLFSETLGNPMSRKLKPYLGDSQKLVKFDVPGINTDFFFFGSTPQDEQYLAYVQSKAWVTSTLPQLVALERSWIRGPCSDAIVAQRLIRNYGDDDQLLSTVPLHPEGAETRRVFLFEESLMAGAWTFQTRLGDAVGFSHHYAIDRWDARMTATDLEVGSSAL